MSRASDLRDAIREYIEENLDESHSVQSFDRVVIPKYRRDNLKAGPRVAVWVASRDPNVMQGPDTTDIIIGVGVAGVGPDQSEVPSDQDYQEAEIDRSDSYDDIAEALLAFWMNRGELAKRGICEHSLRNIKHSIRLDRDHFENHSGHFSFFLLTYRDSED